MSAADVIDDRAAPPVLGEPVGPRFHEGRRKTGDRFCHRCRQRGDARPFAIAVWEIDQERSSER